jgi:hypothetical protein
MPMRPVIGKIPIVARTVRKHAVTLTHLVVQTKTAFIQRTSSNKHSQTMPQSVLHPAEVHPLLCPHHRVSRLLVQLLLAEEVLAELVAFGMNSGEIV